MTSKFATDQFLEACSANGTLQVQMECQGKHGVTEKTVSLPFLVAGRDENSDLVLDDDQVSLRHAYLQIIGGRLFCVDLRTRTGTFWATGSKASGWVDPGQSIRIGPYVLNFYDYGIERFPPPETDFHPLTSPAPDLESLPEVTLEFVSGPSRPLTWRINRALTLIGRSNDCGVSLRNTSVSAFHGGLLRTSGGTWVIDLLGRGGIALNGHPVRWGRLDPGDQLQVGNYVLRFRPETAMANGPGRSSPVGPVINGFRGRNRHDSGFFAGPANNETPNMAPAIDPSSNAGRQAFALAPTLDRAAINETIVMPLVNHFATLQNEMFSKFQESIMMMVETFGRMHKEQMGLIRTEVDRLHDLTEELQTLQAELARRPAPPLATPVVPSVPILPAMEESSLASVGTLVQELPPQEAASAPEVPSAPEATPVKPSAYSFTPAPKEPPLELPQPKEATTTGDVHLWLHERINALQRERESILKKLFNFMVGK